MHLRTPVLLVALLAVSTCKAQKPGFLLEVPKRITSDAVVELPLHLYNVDADGSVTVTVYGDNDPTVAIAQVQKDITNGESTLLQLKVPSTTHVWGTVQANGSFATTPPYEFSKSRRIYLRQVKNITIIETDKPMYKPGQNVRFRLLAIDGKTLKPLLDIENATVWLEDPNRVRLEQWLGVSFASGIVQLEYQLSDDPVQGQWTIYVDSGKRQDQQTFRVEEYVLPKFSVDIKNPPYILADAENITWTICGKYTYGKLVHGTIKLKATYPKYHWEHDRDHPEVTHEGPIEGCYVFTVNSKDLNFSMNSYTYRGIELFAEITEKGTDVARNATTTIYRTNTPLTLSFTSGEYFKPGLPYHGRLKVTNPDNSPAVDEEVEICAVSQKELWTSRRWGSIAETDCKVYFSNEEGQVHFIVPPKSPDSVSIKLEARALRYDESRKKSPRIYQPTGSKQLRAWYSPSGSLLQIQPIYVEGSCRDKLDVSLYLTADESAKYNLKYQLYSRGILVLEGSTPYIYNPDDRVSFNATDDDILSQDEYLTKSYLTGTRVTLPPHVVRTSFTFSTKPEMSPKSRLLVFYVREDGETVPDTQEINFEKCLPNKVTFKFGNERQQPATTASFHVKAFPQSICGIGAVDKSVYLQQQGQDVEQRVFQDLSSQDVNRYSGPSQDTPNYCTEYMKNPVPPLERPVPLMGHDQKRSIRRPYPRPPSYERYRYTTAYVDALTAFEEMGVQALTDLTIETRPCWRRFTDSYYPSYGGGGYPGPVAFATHSAVPLTSTIPATAPERNTVGSVPLARPIAFESAAPAPGAGFAAADKVATPVLKSAVEVRDYFPETWLWEVDTVGDDGELDVKTKFPHSITQWVGKAICISTDAGLGISKPATITGYQDFFVEYTLPYSVVRGELLWLPISVFNYLEECLSVTLKMDPSEEFELVNGTADVPLCVCGGSETHKYLIRPQKLGQLNITARAFSSQDAGLCGDKKVSKALARDAATKQLLVEAEGFPVETTQSRFFCGNFETVFDLSLPEDVVEGSSRAYVSTSGDLMGPALTGIDKLIRMPTGCGEQNMILFVPNIVALDYLTAIGKLTDEMRDKAVRNLKSGYARQLNYKRSDNSFSAFGNSDDSGSLWLTLFVLRHFYAAKQYIPIDQGVIDNSMKWVTSKILPNGCVPRVGRILHGGLRGGLEASQDSQGPLTAYAVATFYEIKYNGTAVIDDAISCMEKQPPLTAYAMALYAYAMALAKKPSAEMYLNLLKEKQVVEGDLVFWKDMGDLNSKAIQVETASYVVKTILLLKGKDGVTDCLPIVRWISRQRNSYGGFISTQDTIVALSALSEYAKYIQTDEVNTKLRASGNEFEKEFAVDESNKILYQSAKVSELPTPLEIQAEGTGCAFVQATMKYNVMTPPETQVFNLSVTAKNANENDVQCKGLSISACFHTVNLKKPTNMAVLEIKMLSGYTPDQELIGQQLQEANIKVKRYEVEENRVNLYFDEVTENESCVKFNAIKGAEVENLQEANAKIYDYYIPDRASFRTSYTIDPVCQASGKPINPVVIAAGNSS